MIFCKELVTQIKDISKKNSGLAKELDEIAKNVEALCDWYNSQIDKEAEVQVSEMKNKIGMKISIPVEDLQMAKEMECSQKICEFYRRVTNRMLEELVSMGIEGEKRSYAK